MPGLPAVASSSAAAAVSPAVSSQWQACSRASLRAASGPEQLGGQHEQLDGRQLPSVGESGVGAADALGGELRARAEVGPQLVAERAVGVVDGRRRGGVQRGEPPGERSSSTAARISGWVTSTTRRPPRTCMLHQPVLDGLRQRCGEVDRRRHAGEPVELEGAGTATAATSCSVSGAHADTRASTIDA